MENTFEFPVELQTILTINPVSIENGGSDDVIRGRKAVVRQDTGDVLGIVSDKYQLLEHKDVIQGFREALKDIEHSEKITMKKNGAQMFAEYRLSSIQVEVKPNDIVGLRLIVKNSYDGSNSLQIILGAFRLVCSNGMIIGKRFFTYSQRHIGSETGIKVEKLSANISKMTEQFKDTLPSFQEMSRQQVVTEKDQMFDTKLVKLPQYLLDSALIVYEQSDDRTRWGYYNALTSAITHDIKTKGDEVNPQAQISYGKVAFEVSQTV